MSNSHVFTWGVMTVTRGSIAAFGKAMREHPEGRIRIYDPSGKLPRGFDPQNPGDVPIALGHEDYYVGPVTKGWETPLYQVVTRKLKGKGRTIKLEITRMAGANRLVVSTLLVEVVPSAPIDTKQNP